MNDQETLRTSLDVTISAEAMRQSDLLAFELAIEKGKPGSVMCSYNLINGRWGCENDYLLNKVLKHDWGFKGFVMSDWGAVHSTADAANDGLDQFTGFCCVGDKPWFAPTGDEGGAAIGRDPASAGSTTWRADPLGAVRQGRRSTIRSRSRRSTMQPMR